MLEWWTDFDKTFASFANDQIGYHRPFKGAGTYRTEIPGLYSIFRN